MNPSEPHNDSNSTVSNHAGYPTAQFDHVVSAVRELKHPTQIGPYHILSLIGEGGMGQVFRAEQREPIHRVVAIKIIKLGMDTAQVIARFESERQALALMNHVNVARVLDAGATETGRPYFVMEYVAGEPITTFCDRRKLTLRERLTLFVQACDAVQHAHQKAIIHRDLKPSNILVTLQDGKPLVKVIDFGVAKALSQRLTERTLFTETGQLVGTPEYMSPEQAEMSGLDVDTRADVYSLGVVLYELLSGSLPFDPKTLRSAGYNEIQRIIRDVDPPRPSTRLSSLGAEAQEVARLRQTPLESLHHQLKRELEWIPLKAMQKDRARRYASAVELSEDVQNYLHNRPLRAAPDSAAYRVRKFIRRNKRGVGAAAAMILLLLLGVATTTWQAIRATRERNLAIAARAAEAEAREYEKQTDKFLMEMFTSIDPRQARGRDVLVRDILDQATRRIDATPPSHPLVEASLRKIFGSAYLALGLPQQALAQLRQAAELDRGNDLASLRRRAQILNDMALVQKELAQLPEAESTMQASLDLSRAVVGPNHADTIAAESSLATIFMLQDKLLEAEKLLTDALNRTAASHETIDIGARASVVNNLANLRLVQGRFPDAEKLYRDTLDELIKSVGEDHPDTITLMSNLADLLRNQGRLDEAIPLQARVVELAARVMGNDHPSTLITLNNYALGLAAVGQLEKAENVYLDVIERNRRAFGDDHSGTLLARSNYGLLQLRMNRLDEASVTFRDVSARMARVNGPDHSSTIIAEGNLAWASTLNADFDGAESIYRQLVPRATRALGADHPVAVVLMMRYGEVLSRLEHWSQAKPLLADAYARVKQQGIDARLGVAAAAYGVCLARLGEYESAEAPLREAQARLVAVDPHQREHLRAALSALIELCEVRRNPDEAARWREQLQALDPPATQSATGS